MSRNANSVCGYWAGMPKEIRCIYCGAMAPVNKKSEAQCPDCGAVIQPGDYLRSDEKLAHIIWRVGKQLVSLLEKEYGFGKKPQPGKMIGDDAGKDRVFSGNPGLRPMAGMSQEHPNQTLGYSAGAALEVNEKIPA